jgi:hypothetical protein
MFMIIMIIVMMIVKHDHYHNHDNNYKNDDDDDDPCLEEEVVHVLLVHVPELDAGPRLILHVGDLKLTLSTSTVVRKAAARGKVKLILSSLLQDELKLSECKSRARICKGLRSLGIDSAIIYSLAGGIQ